MKTKNKQTLSFEDNVKRVTEDRGRYSYRVGSNRYSIEQELAFAGALILVEKDDPLEKCVRGLNVGDMHKMVKFFQNFDFTKERFYAMSLADYFCEGPQSSAMIYSILRSKTPGHGMLALEAIRNSFIWLRRHKDINIDPDNILSKLSILSCLTVIEWMVTELNSVMKLESLTECFEYSKKMVGPLYKPYCEYKEGKIDDIEFGRYICNDCRISSKAIPATLYVSPELLGLTVPREGMANLFYLLERKMASRIAMRPVFELCWLYFKFNSKDKDTEKVKKLKEEVATVRESLTTRTTEMQKYRKEAESLSKMQSLDITPEEIETLQALLKEEEENSRRLRKSLKNSEDYALSLLEQNEALTSENAALKESLSSVSEDIEINATPYINVIKDKKILLIGADYLHGKLTQAGLDNIRVTPAGEPLRNKSELGMPELIVLGVRFLAHKTQEMPIAMAKELGIPILKFNGGGLMAFVKAVFCEIHK